MGSTSEAMALALAHHQAGRLHEAEQIYRQVVELDSSHAEAWHLLGAIAFQSEDLPTAIAYMGRALELDPDHAQANNNLGLALQEQGKTAEAAVCYLRALALKPNFPAAHYNLGRALQTLGNLDNAASSYARALTLQPNYPDAYNNLGKIFRDQGKLDEAIACYRRTLQIKPDYARTHNNLGVALLEQGKAHEAAENFRRAVELKPDFLVAHSNLLCTLLFCPGCDAATIFKEHRRFNELHAKPLANQIRPHRNDRTPDRRLRIGYVSPDFREHCLSYFTAPLFSAHDRERFEIFCYSDVAKPDHVTERLRSFAHVWRSIVGLSDQEVADLVRQDEIDILVDLTMHLEENRVLLFARKPAPVQICWEAYPGTTGLTAMDYRLTDPYLDPPGLFDRFYSESSVRLPDTFWCYDPPADEVDVGPLPALRNEHITFGSLNTFYKMNDTLLDLWASVLNTVEGSRIILLAPIGSARERVLELFARRGVTPARVTFVGRVARAQYLDYYNQIDIGLDTVPYNGHTTSMDSFWMGVPVVTLVGQTVVGRAGVCLLTNLGLPKLIAQTAEQYVQIAAELAADRDQLIDLRAGLRDRMASSPLMDAPRFACGVEAAFRGMWQKWCDSES